MKDGIKYLETGDAVEVVGPTVGGYIVRKIYEDEETGEPLGLGNPRIVSAIFDKPPVEKRHKEIAALDDERRVKSMELMDMEQKVYTLEKQRNEILACFELSAEARAIAALIRGDAWWVTNDRIGPMAMSHAEFFAHMRKRGRDSHDDDYQVTLGLRLDMQERGSRNPRTLTMKLWPPTAQEVFATEEEAWDECRRIAADQLGRYVSQGCIDSADRLGVPVPPEVREKVKGEQRARAEKVVAEAQARLDAAHAALAAVAPHE